MSAKLVRVKATKQGFYGELRKPNEIFNVIERHKQASWYVPVDLAGNLEKAPVKENEEGLTDEPGIDDNDELELGEGEKDEAKAASGVFDQLRSKSKSKKGKTTATDSLV